MFTQTASITAVDENLFYTKYTSTTIVFNILNVCNPEKYKMIPHCLLDLSFPNDKR